MLHHPRSQCLCDSFDPSSYVRCYVLRAQETGSEAQEDYAASSHAGTNQRVQRE